MKKIVRSVTGIISLAGINLLNDNSKCNFNKSIFDGAPWTTKLRLLSWYDFFHKLDQLKQERALTSSYSCNLSTEK